MEQLKADPDGPVATVRLRNFILLSERTSAPDLAASSTLSVRLCCYHSGRRVLTENYRALIALPLVGMGLRGSGISYSKKPPGDVQTSVLQFCGDFVMFFQLITGQLPFE